MKSSGANKPRAGAVRKGRKGPQVGSGGQGRQALEGKKPTPKAEDRPYHPAGKRKAAQERFVAAGGQRGKASSSGAPQRQQRSNKPKQSDDIEVVTGRNSVLEALRANIPATALYIATRIEYDDRVKEVMSIATKRGLPILEVMRPELDRLAGFDSVHQGLALKVPPYEYAHPIELLDNVISRGQVPLLVALDGVTDPRNLGAIIRSVAAFGGQGVIVPQRARPWRWRRTSLRRSRRSRSAESSCSDWMAAATSLCRASAGRRNRSSSWWAARARASRAS
jgi:23S rRNA (guanosine2251-2'-O)-methyltransferase